MYRKCLPRDRFSLPLVLKEWSRVCSETATAAGPPHGGGIISDEVTVASSSSQPPALHTPRQTAPWPDRRRCSEKKMVQGRETLDWLNLGELFSTSLCSTSSKDWQERRFSFA
jgi:hypothetical protein